MFDEVGIPYYCLVFFDGGRKLEHWVAKLSVVVEIVGFSDIRSAAEEKRTGDDKKLMETEESIPYILYWLWYPDVEISHFSIPFSILLSMGKLIRMMSGISSNDTKYSALVANLDAETLSYVSDIVLSPPNSDKYHTLSQRLITQFSDSETQKIKKLLTDLQLGDEKPSHLLRKMKELSNGQL
ncbi:uncharacterized protein TNCV_1435201 [Trichonephila clavipes]|nr:uncharacterized protein TNCV_1435201 [Trichonephila clavipes]